MNRGHFLKILAGGVVSSIIPISLAPVTTSWSIECSKDLYALHSIDISGDLARMMSLEIQKEIDREMIERMIKVIDRDGHPIPITLKKQI